MTLLVVGALHLDVVVQAPKLPSLDETVVGRDVEYVSGGKGGNQAIAAARMGATVGFAGRIGSDDFGAKLKSTLQGAGVDVSQLQRGEGASGMSVAIVDRGGDYGAVIVSAANLEIEADPIQVPKATRLLLLQNEVPEAVNLSVARKAKDKGALVWLNAAPARKLSPELLGLLDLVIVNRVEAQFYQNLSSPPAVLQTLGADGVRFMGSRHPGHVVNVVSTHGAGDMFAGALAARVAEGCSVEASIAFAQAAAALYVSTPLERRPGLCRAEVREFLARTD